MKTDKRVVSNLSLDTDNEQFFKYVFKLKIYIEFIILNDNLNLKSIKIKNRLKIKRE